MSNAIEPWWDQLLSSLAAAHARRDHTQTQLATTRGPGSGRLEGRPACRTVNIRICERRKVYFVSDMRSGKADDVTNGPTDFAELCWYVPETKKQFRLAGRLKLRSADDALAAKVWDSLSQSERTWWTWPTPAQPRGRAEEYACAAPEKPPPHFCVGELVADHVDVVDLGRLPFEREMHDRKDDVGDEDDPKAWVAQRVNP